MLCLDWDCGHRLALHKGGTGYCHMPGCHCMGMMRNEVDLKYFRRNEYAPPADNIKREVLYGPDPNFARYVAEAKRRRGEQA